MCFLDFNVFGLWSFPFPKPKPSSIEICFCTWTPLIGTFRPSKKAIFITGPAVSPRPPRLHCDYHIFWWIVCIRLIDHNRGNDQWWEATDKTNFDGFRKKPLFVIVSPFCYPKKPDSHSSLPLLKEFWQDWFCDKKIFSFYTNQAVLNSNRVWTALPVHLPLS